MNQDQPTTTNTISPELLEASEAMHEATLSAHNFPTHVYCTPRYARAVLQHQLVEEMTAKAIAEGKVLRRSDRRRILRSARKKVKQWRFTPQSSQPR